jgi:hypothetical protein
VPTNRRRHPENQLDELRRYVAARGWQAVEYIDRGISGAKEARPGLNQLLSDAKKRKVRYRDLLATGPVRAEPPAPDLDARRTGGARCGFRQPE